MSEVPNPEITPSPEALAMQALDTSAERVFAEYDARRTPPQYNPEGVGVEDVIVDPPTMTVIRRRTAVDGGVSYQFSSNAWNADADRGGTNRDWQKGGTEITRATVSEVQGITYKEAGDIADIQHVKAGLEKAFPPKTAAQGDVAAGGLRGWFKRHR